MSIPQIYLLLLGSVLPPDHPGWDDPDIVSKDFTSDGSEKAVQIIGCELEGIRTAAQFSQLTRDEKVKHQIRCMEQEFELFKISYTDMSFVEVRPRIGPNGEMIFPRKRDYINAWKMVVENSTQRRYFGVYYTGMAQVGTGNWVVLPDNPKQGPSQQVDFITMTMLFRFTESLGYQQGFIWMSLDCPFGGNWILQAYKEHSLYTECFSNILMDCATDQFNTPDWCQYIVRLINRFQSIWNRSTPIAFNKSFQTVVWPDKTNQAIPYPNKVFEWVDYQTHREINVEGLED